MYLIFTFFSYIMIIIFFYSWHPLFMSMMIAFQSILIGMTIYLFNFISWFSYLLFMIFLSGMMIILIYVSSLASNLLMKYFLLDLKTLTLFVLIFMLPLFFSFSTDHFYGNNMNFSNFSNLGLMAGKMYYKDFYLFTVLIICYLLVLLILVVKNSVFTEGPLRSCV
uniref:NADH dehydrogenase subunit 6 n=1 Tax=Metacrangonyx longicaudus TaxID=1199243 RepID=K7ZW13_9CRUS|nr:NADH dehydrogenase subunit 6 [Metacrangonyx longicaudus]CCI69456.1 NADH dehydrogenase subunit 6 [Metacrangonyx longicaudus]